MRALVLVGLQGLFIHPIFLSPDLYLYQMKDLPSFHPFIPSTFWPTKLGDNYETVIEVYLLVRFFYAFTDL